MDIFCEYIVKKKKEKEDYLKIAGVIVGALLVSYLLVGAIYSFLTFLAGFSFVFVIGVFYYAYKLIKNSSIEYEYILTNNELDIDKIIAKSARKRMLTVNFREIEICANILDETKRNEYNNSADKTLLKYYGDKNAENVYFVDFYDGSKNMRLLFQPNEKILKGIKSVSPSKVFILE